MDYAVLWDRLAGGLLVYVENYLLAKAGGKMKPSYPVDYEVANAEKLLSDRTIDDFFAYKVVECRDVNLLPEDLKKLVLQYLPKFYDTYPEYKGEKCLVFDEAKPGGE